MAEELQKHHLLVKLLKMTTSSNDGEALVAVRKANSILTEAGWDWDRLMAGKITVVGDPFANLGDPLAGKPRVDTGYAPRPFSRPPSQPTKHTTYPIGKTANKYEGHCYCCGKLIAIGGGFIFAPADHHSQAPSKLHVVCTTCNTSAVVLPSAAPRQGRGARKVTADDLA